MRAPFVVAEGVAEAGAGGVHAGQVAVPEADGADQEHHGHPCVCVLAPPREKSDCRVNCRVTERVKNTATFTECSWSQRLIKRRGCTKKQSRHTLNFFK